MSRVLPQLQLDCSLALRRMTVKSTAITDFFNNQAAATSATPRRKLQQGVSEKKTYKKDLTNSQK